MLIKVKFFGEFKEKIGLTNTELEVSSSQLSKEKLIHLLKEKFKIKENEIFNVAVNNSLKREIIKEGDTVSVHPIYRGG